MRAFVIAALGTIVAASVAVSGQAQQPQAAPPTGNGFLAGQVVEVASGKPIPNATVQLIGRFGGSGRPGGPAGNAGPVVFTRGSLTAPVMADSQGRFFFSALTPGLYSVSAAKPGYATAPVVASRTAEIGDGTRVLDWKVRLSKLALLAGTLRDSTGDPIVGTDVLAIRRTVVGGRVNFEVSTRSRSDDRGAYRLVNLTPGDYFVCACAQDAIPFDGQLLTTLAAEPSLLMGVAGRALMVGADVATLDNTLRTHPPMFYPSSATIAQATRLTLASGDERSGIDFTLETTRAARVSGTIVGATGPVFASSTRLVPAGETDDAAELVSLSPVLVQPDGRFDFAGVPPGQYILRVRHVAYAANAAAPSGTALQFLGQRMSPNGIPGNTIDEPMQWASQPVTVTEAGVTGLTVPLHTSTKVSGHVEFTGSAPPSQVLRAMVVILVPSTPAAAAAAPGLNTIGRVTPDGTFEIRGVPPGRYIVSTTFVAGGASMQSVKSGGTDITDLAMDVGASDVTDLVLTYADGRVSTLAGTGVTVPATEDLTALIFPVDRKYWPDPLAAQRRFRLAPIGRNGSFLPASLPAGEYFVLVVPDTSTADWLDASKLEAWSAKAQRVSLGEGETKTIEVRR
jgi:hypothetical protein